MFPNSPVFQVAARRACWMAPVLLGACFTYQPVRLTTVPERADVRLTLTPEGGRLLADAAGMRLAALTGLVERVEGDSAVMVRPVTVVTEQGDELPWRQGLLAIPSRAVARTEQRVMNKAKSRGVAVGIAAAFAGMVVYALRSIGRGGGATIQTGPGAPE